MSRRRAVYCLVLAPLACACTAHAQDASADDGVHQLPGVVVIGQRAPEQTAASLDRIEVAALPGRENRSVSEVLQRVPGVAARERQNLAQDVQLSVRGYGARSSFGVRGLRLFVDGIPATMPDGQGQVSHVPLSALARVEVLRGPFSALYGNASGGVLAFSSAGPPGAAALGFDASGGNEDSWRLGLWAGGPWAAARAGGWRVDGERLDAGGYREHSRARRDVAQARLLFGTEARTQVALTANALDLAAADPQGLDAAQVRADPRAASVGALLFDTRKRVRQRQLGLHVAHPAGDHDRLELWAHGGERATFQMLSVPVAAQAAPGSGGGVIDLARDYAGADLRWRHRASWAGRPIDIVVGAAWQQSGERRRGYENFAGGQLGVVGALRRDERDTVSASDAYLEAHWRFAPRWSATVGARRSAVRFRTDDDYVAPGNGDDSGRLRHARTTPVAGLLFAPATGVTLYANAGRGFETPTFSELAYRDDGASGLNTALRPARSRSAELGLRLRRGGHALEVVAFASRTRDELVVASNRGGRSTYANAARSRRDGWELSADGPLGADWHYALALTRLVARYQDAFATCRAPPCTMPDTVVAAGNRIPATAPGQAFAELRWTPRADLVLFAQGNAIGRRYADDANTG
ncbi:MAG TPA: TonB-dependent receptor, partial [Xanthomonadaceae bacterium]|nr:TonB-dependent receptor [Xanthomonadaceae bacterium]